MASILLVMQLTLTEATAFVLRSEMAGQDLSVDAFAKALGVHPITATRIRRGRSALDTDQFAAAANFLGMTPPDLFDAAWARLLASTPEAVGS